MAKRSREILALILLFVLVFVGLVAIIAYMTIGHSWNVTATNIDDSVGNLSGYTVLVYEGQREEEMPDKATGAATTSSTASSSTAADGSSATASSGSSSTAASSGSSSTSSSSSSSSSKNKDAVSFAGVVQSYCDKEASVIELDVAHPEEYEEPLILYRNGSRIAIFSVSDSTTAIGLDKVMTFLKSLNIDYTIVISNTTPTAEEIAEQTSSSDSKSSSSSASSSSTGSSTSSKSNVATFNEYLLGHANIDIVIDLVRDKYTTSGVNSQGKFLVSAPTKGNAGVVTVSPSNVVSAKTIELSNG